MIIVGNQSEVSLDESKQDEKGFGFCFYTTSLKDSLKGVAFPKYKTLTFCDKDCMISFLKENILDGGKTKEK